MREICFDTETTGLDPDTGDRLVEIGAVELINHLPTGKIYHEYINPERDVPEEVVKVHGLDNEFLKDKPVFRDIAQSWIEFIGDDGILVAHNAAFDLKFINFELKKCGFQTYEWDRVVDTLAIARNEFPGARNNLDALCRRFNIDNSARTYHGALLDAQLLAEVYLQLLGVDEPSINFVKSSAETSQKHGENIHFYAENVQKRSFSLSAEEQQAHLDFLSKSIKNALWLQNTESEAKKDA